MGAPATKPKLNLENTLAAVLSHPIRVRCFVALNERTASATQLMRAWGLRDVGLVSHHIRILEKIGIVEEVGNRPVRGSLERFYRATARPIVFEEDFAKMSLEERSRFTRYILQLFVTDAALAVDQGTYDERTNRAIMRMPMTVDQEGFDELAQEELESYERRLAIEARSSARMAERRRRGEDPGAIPVRSFTTFFEAASGGGALADPPPDGGP